MGLTYKKSKKIALKTILILAGITVVEVLIALTGKGYLFEGTTFNPILIGGAMIILSLIKAQMIVMEFMHMKYEVSGLMRSVLLPTLLLVWGVIALLWEGDTWGKRRAKYYPKAEQVLVTDKQEMQSNEHHSGEGHGSDTHDGDHGEEHGHDHSDEHGDDH